jgi:hypothetical protein
MMRQARVDLSRNREVGLVLFEEQNRLTAFLGLMFNIRIQKPHKRKV